MTVVLQPVCSAEAAAETSSTGAQLAVVFPQVRQPFQKVYQTIAKGAAEGFAGPTSEIILDADKPATDLESRIADHMVVALGGRGITELQPMTLAHPLVVGAVSRRIPHVYGMSMVPEESLIVTKLHVLAPEVRRVFVIVRSHDNIIDLKSAQLAFNQLGIQLHIHEAEDLRAAAGIYRKVIRSLGSGDAVWIPSGDRFVGNALLSILLQASWKSEFVVFSSNPTHVKRGALFSVYPDNFQMGVRLGELARKIAEGEQQQAGMEPLQSVFVTLNERTSNHLGILLTDDMKEH
ncbi:MAG: ABC transporter substrate binding protein, partial [Porticoccaceae bacterium]